jgi:hypothetical protein
MHAAKLSDSCPKDGGGRTIVVRPLADRAFWAASTPKGGSR